MPASDDWIASDCKRERILLFGLDERVGDLLGAVGRGDQYEKGASSDDQAKGAGSLIAFVVWKIYQDVNVRCDGSREWSME